MNLKGTLLVGVDDTPMAKDAVEFALLLAECTGATVALAHVVRSEAPDVAGWDALEQDRRAAGEGICAGAAEQHAGRAPIETHTVVARSDAHGLSELAEQLDAAAIVVGSSRHGAVGRVLVGSVGERLLHGATRPVIVTPREHATAGAQIGHVGVAFDGGDEALAALDTAAELARATAADLKLIAVADPAAFVESSEVMPELGTAELVKAYEKSLNADIERAIGGLKSPPPVSGEVLIGPVAKMLAEDAAKELDLLVCGSRGYGPVKVVLIGSVSAKLVRSAHCPVMVVPRG